jgi:hypothetical protein
MPKAECKPKRCRATSDCCEEKEACVFGLGTLAIGIFAGLATGALLAKWSDGKDVMRSATKMANAVNRLRAGEQITISRSRTAPGSVAEEEEEEAFRRDYMWRQ